MYLYPAYEILRRKGRCKMKWFKETRQIGRVGTSFGRSRFKPHCQCILAILLVILCYLTYSAPVAAQTGSWEMMSTHTQEYASYDVPKNIPGKGTETSILTIADTGSIVDLNVKLNITHPYDADMEIFLIAPDGMRVELFTDVGDWERDFIDTVLDDEASKSITEGRGPFTGSFRPEGNLADMDDKDIAGTWTLEVTDDASSNRVGTLNAWSLIIEQESDRPPGAKYGGGTGEPDDPYKIATAADLITLGGTPGDYDKCFILTADIDLNPNLPGCKVFDMAVIGPDVDSDESDYQGTGFTGVFDGNGHTISHLTITGEGYLGLFGHLASGSQVINISLVDVSVVGSESYVGGLAGENFGSITMSYSAGVVEGDIGVGGLVGSNAGSLTQCFSSSVVDGTGWWVGGLVGVNYDSIATSFSIGRVRATNSVGGLVGYNSGSIATSYSNSAVTGTSLGVGGLVGYNGGFTVIHCSSTGAVSGGQPGGLMGVNQGDVIACFWDTQTSGQTWSAGGTGKTTTQMKTASTFLNAGWDFVDETTNGTEDIWRIIEGQDYPRLWWEEPRAKYSGGTGDPKDPYQIATMEDLVQLGDNPEDYDKHFILTADIDLNPNLPGRKVFNKAIIAPHAGSFGWPFSGPPFAGVFDGGDHTISNLTITGIRCAGLLGQLASGSEVKNVKLVGVNIDGSDGYTGGLVGLASSAGAAVTNCSCEGTISGHSYIGGLVGYGGARVTRCYSNGEVYGSKWSIGGLVGYSCGYIQQCYSTATVSGASWVGGLVGENANTVIECYSTGSVTGYSSIGGLVGYDYPYSQAIRCFWDTQTSKRTWSAGGTGKTTAQMQTASTFLDAGWDFVDETENGTEDIWWILEGQDYPRLWWELIPEN